MTRSHVLLCLAAIYACSNGQVSDSGSDAALHVRGATFVKGRLPSSEGGPRVESAFLGQTRFPAGFQGKSLSGALGESATALLLRLALDYGYWIVPAGPPGVEAPSLPTFDARLSFSNTLPAGSYQLELAAVDDRGRLGEPKVVPFTLTAAVAPDAALVFSLTWDRPSDLDLHVTLPDGREVYKDEMNSWEPTSVGEPDSGGRLDLDSNAGCRIDGRNVENVIFAHEPPAGVYTLRVDTFSLCGEPAARWTAAAVYLGQQVALVSGESLPSDTRSTHGAGAGITAFELTVR